MGQSVTPEALEEGLCFSLPKALSAAKAVMPIENNFTPLCQVIF
jgi:hypothetical protein